MKASPSVAGSTPAHEFWTPRLRVLLDTRYFSLVSVLATYGLIVLGGTVRVSGAGLACPDWPLCEGELIPPLDRKVLLEYSHRIAASVVGLLVALTLLSAWLRRGEHPAAFWGAAVSFVLLIAQVLLGAATVDKDNSATLVALHLAAALGLLMALIFTAVDAFRPSKRATVAALPAFVTTAALTSAVLFALIVTGSYVANTGASLVYPDWPLFDGSAFSQGGRLGNLHYAHRLVAAVSGVFMLAVAWQAWLKERTQFLIMAAVGVALVLYVAQVFIGAANIWFALASPVRIAHLAIASATWAILVWAAIWRYLNQRPQVREA